MAYSSMTQIMIILIILLFYHVRVKITFAMILQIFTSIVARTKIQFIIIMVVPLLWLTSLYCDNTSTLFLSCPKFSLFWRCLQLWWELYLFLFHKHLVSIVTKIEFISEGQVHTSTVAKIKFILMIQVLSFIIDVETFIKIMSVIFFMGNCFITCKVVFILITQVPILVW